MFSSLLFLRYYKSWYWLLIAPGWTISPVICYELLFFKHLLISSISPSCHFLFMQQDWNVSNTIQNITETDLNKYEHQMYIYQCSTDYTLCTHAINKQQHIMTLSVTPTSNLRCHLAKVSHFWWNLLYILCKKEV